jgi:predicted secreted protein
MTFTSIIAIYILFWVISAFLVLPFGVKTHQELGMEMTPGQADSAPGNFKPLRVIIYTTMLSLILFGLFYANYVYGWIDRHSFGFEDLLDG